MLIRNGLVVQSNQLDSLVGETEGRLAFQANTALRGTVCLVSAEDHLIRAVADLCEIVPLEGTSNEAYEWVLTRIIRLDSPLPCRCPPHRPRWILLDPETQRAVADSLGSLSSRPTLQIAGLGRSSEGTHRNQSAAAVPESMPEISPDPGTLLVPYSADGTVFGPHLVRESGRIWVGAKGDERSFGLFEEALAFLKTQSPPRWRRPNANGNWGIVTGIGWRPYDRSGQVELPQLGDTPAASSDEPETTPPSISVPLPERYQVPFLEAVRRQQRRPIIHLSHEAAIECTHLLFKKLWRDERTPLPPGYELSGVSALPDGRRLVVKGATYLDWVSAIFKDLNFDLALIVDLGIAIQDRPVQYRDVRLYPYSPSVDFYVVPRDVIEANARRRSGFGLGFYARKPGSDGAAHDRTAQVLAALRNDFRQLRSRTHNAQT
jgi:hypothetical protein